MDLYVADYQNRRVQLFHPEQFKGNALDADHFLIILDKQNFTNLVMIQRPGGFHNIMQHFLSGCKALDTYGNSYISQTFFERIAKLDSSNNIIETAYYTEPELSFDSRWNTSVVTIVRSKRVDPFIDANSIAYVGDRTKGRIHKWSNSGALKTSTIFL